MSRIQIRFNALSKNKKKALIPFITAGDPSPDVTIDLMHDLVEAGADMIELGIPFSDPMADGIVIQRASERALALGINIDHIINIVQMFRQKNISTPVILMGYLNTIEAVGYRHFAKTISMAGVDGILIVDLPPEEAKDMVDMFQSKDIDQIFLVAPTTDAERIKHICNLASGFIYYVSLKGVTGSDQLNIDRATDKLNSIRLNTDLPVAVGFGIKTPETAAHIGRISDAVVIGSALVEKIADHLGDITKMRREISSFVRSLRNALDTI